MEYVVFFVVFVVFVKFSEFRVDGLFVFWYFLIPYKKHKKGSDCI